MRIGSNSQPSQPTSSPRAAAAPAEAAAEPKMAGDFFSPDANAVNVATFNVAGGASAFQLEGKLTDTPLLQKVIQGSPDAPVVACQEMTPALAEKLIELSKNGNFQVIYPGKTWVPGWVPTSTLMQGNLLLVPKRYQVAHVEAETFKGRLEKFFDAFKGFLFHHEAPKQMLLAAQNRGYVSAALKDTKTGKSFTVVATHIAYDDAIRREEAPQLVRVIERAQAKGPTVVMGDFNVEIPTEHTRDKGTLDFWKALEATKLEDMGPTGKEGASFWRNGKNIDWVLATGFKSLSHEMLTGDKAAIPDHPDAKQVSDHYAEADSLAFE